MLTLWPPWSIWADMRTYINVSGTNDSVQRIYILLTSVPLIRYPAHAAALQVEIAVESVPGSEEQMDIFVTDDTEYKPLEWAVAFFPDCSGWWSYSRMPGCCLSSARPTSCKPPPSSSPCLCFLPPFGVRSVSTAVIVFTVGVVLEIVGKHIATLAISWIKARNPKMVFIPAQEIGHAIEKTAAFFVFVCGKILLGTLLDPPGACDVLRAVQPLPTSLKLRTRLG